VIKKPVSGSDPLCSSYHKFAVEWNTDRMIYYLNDLPLGANYNNLSFIMDPMRLVISPGINSSSGYGNNFDFYHGTTFPQYMKVDYFHYYTLRLDCLSNLTLNSNSDVTNYWTTGVPAVKSNIIFGNGTSSITLSTDVKYVFRFVNSLTINGEFIIPSNSELTLMPTPCN